MNDVWIIGKGESLQRLTKKHIGKGIVMTINSSIQQVEALNLSNLTFALFKDGASPEYLNECPSMDCSFCPYGNVYPQRAIMLLHRHESIQCMPDYYPKMILDAEKYGLNWKNESVLLLIEFALSLGCDSFHFVCFDAVTNGSINALYRDNEILENGHYLQQAERLKERCKTLTHEFIETK